MNTLKTLIFIFSFTVLPYNAFAQTHYDLFPLSGGLYYKYNFYQQEKTWEVMVLAMISSDSGSVEYFVQDSIKYGDTLIVWNIEQQLNLMHLFVDGNDTISYSLVRDTSYYTIKEYLSGNHELECSSLVWYFPLNVLPPDWYFTFPDSSMYRYSDSTSEIKIISESELGIICEDTIWSSVNQGMYKRVTTTDVFGGINTYKYVRQLEQLIGPDEVGEIFSNKIQGFVLSQNYPNPFNPSTTIRYSIPIAGNVTLKVFDILGKEIATLVNEEKPAGEYEVEFSATGGGRNLPSGIYFYQLQSGSYVETKKMILLR
jgi:hypothetical protein